MYSINQSRENYGLILGLMAVTAFSLTLPITRLLTQSGLSAWDIGLGRSLIAAIGAIIYLFIIKSKFPTYRQIKKLIIISTGIAFGFPVLTAVGMKNVPASHGAIVLGCLPITTALIGCFLSKEKPSRAYWLVAFFGFLTVISFVFISHGEESLSFYQGDIALFGAVILASLGYAQGGALAKEMSGSEVISWTLVVSLPLLIPLTFYMADYNDFKSLGVYDWFYFLFLSLINSLIGFFWLYKGMALAGIARVSQVQLIQMFMTLFFSFILLGERITFQVVAFTIVTITIIIISKKTPIHNS